MHNISTHRRRAGVRNVYPPIDLSISGPAWQARCRNNAIMKTYPWGVMPPCLAPSSRLRNRRWNRGSFVSRYPPRSITAPRCLFRLTGKERRDELVNSPDTRARGLAEIYGGLRTCFNRAAPRIVGRRITRCAPQIYCPASFEFTRPSG